MLALTIFIITLTLVIWQPRGIGIGWSATGGALVALATGVITFHDIPIVWHIVWNATFTFVALIVISLTLDEAGFFHWCALHIARWAGGRGRLLFPLTILLGAFIAAFFANDGAALLLTPIVLAILLKLGFSRTSAFAFVIGTGFVADTTSLPLVISNLVNIVSANYFDIPFDHYAKIMVPIDLVSLAATLGVLWLYFRRQLPVKYQTDNLESPKHVIRDKTVFQASFPLLGILLLSYFIAAQYAIPVSVVTSTGALALLALAARWHRGGRGRVISIGKVLKEAPWQIVIFSLGMYLVVYGLRNAGLTDYLTQILEWLGRFGPTISAIGMGFISAVLSSVMNNMPSVLIGALAIDQSHSLTATCRQIMIYANVIGCDLGPKFTPIGSLATLLWLHVLERKGETISWGAYMKIGLLLTPPVLFITLLALAIWLPWAGHF